MQPTINAPFVHIDRDWTWVFFGEKPNPQQVEKLKHGMGGRAVRKTKTFDGHTFQGWWWAFKNRQYTVDDFAWMVEDADAYEYLPQSVLDMPKLYSQDNVDDPIVHVKYFLAES